MNSSVEHAALRHSLLDDALIRWRCVAHGDLHRSGLPELFVAMARDEVRDFPALRPHQRHPWHVFLVQLAAIALHRAGQPQPWPDAGDWRAALLALTPDDADGAAWCLVAPPERPALLQAPMLRGLDGWEQGVRTPDALDMLGTSKNHDLKQTRMRCADLDDWLFALVSLQTQAGSNSGSYKGISRMNSGAGTRPCVGVAQRGAWGQRWSSDVGVLLRSRDEIANNYEFAIEGGICLTWLHPWDDSTSLRFAGLDPHYIEICRRVRLVADDAGLAARTFKTPVSRIEESAARKGRTGDAWTPVDREDEKIMAVPKAGFGYERVSQLLLAKRYAPSPAQALTGWPASAALELVCRGIAADGNSRTSGYHERRVPISAKLRGLLVGAQRVILEKIVEHRLHTVKVVVDLLEWCLLALLVNGRPIDTGKDRKLLQRRTPTIEKLIQQFERQEDARFFDDLAVEVDAPDEFRPTERLNWQLELVARSEIALTNAFVLGPRNSMQRYKARAAALSRFHGALRGTKPLLPDLAAHYAQLRHDLAQLPQGLNHD